MSRVDRVRNGGTACLCCRRIEAFVMNFGCLQQYTCKYTNSSDKVQNSDKSLVIQALDNKNVALFSTQIGVVTKITNQKFYSNCSKWLNF